MSKIYISIYAPKSAHISNLSSKLTQFSERVNNEPHINSLDFHLLSRDKFNSNLESQYMTYKRVYYYKYFELSEYQLYVAICTFSSLALREPYHDIEIINFKIQNDKNGLFKLTAYIPITND